MFFANSIYLWSLLGVLLPIGIHLWSRREARTIKVGSIALLEASDSVSSRSIRPNEWWLLFLRTLIVSFLALILSGPRIKGPAPKHEVVYVVEGSLLRSGLPADLGSRSGESPHVRLLEKGLPVWDPDETPPPAAGPPGYWQLVPELNALNADSVLVFTRGYLSGTRSKRPATRGHIRWIGVKNKDPHVQPLLARGNGETAELYTIRSQGEKTTFERRRITASQGTYAVSAGGDSIRLRGENENFLLPLQNNTPLHVRMYTGSEMQADAHYMEAALSAVSNYLDQEIRVEQGPATGDRTLGEADILIWLSPDPLPQVDGKVLFFRPDSLSSELIEPDLKEGHYRLTARLNLGNSMEGHLPEQLLQLLLPPQQWEGLIENADRRQWESAMLGGPPEGYSDNTNKPEGTDLQQQDRASDFRDLSGYFWLVVLALLTLERLLALRRKQ